MLPDVPTVAEQGHAGFDIRFAYLLMAPKDTPDAAKAAAARLVATVFADPAAQARLANWAVTPEAGDGAAAEAWVARASAAWREVVQATGMRVE